MRSSNSSTIKIKENKFKLDKIYNYLSNQKKKETEKDSRLIFNVE